MAVLVAVLLAVFVLPSPWGLVAIVTAAVIELGEAWLYVWYSRRRRSVTGAEGLIGATAVVVEPCNPDGLVRVHGELWKAHSPGWAEVGQTVRIRSIRDLTLEVDPE